MMDGYEHLLVEPGDLILGMDRPVVSAGLKLARVKSQDCPALLVQRVARIRPKRIEGRYLYHLLSSQAFVNHLQSSATGTQLPHVTLRSIREFPVPRFGGHTELRIVDILDDHLSRLDAAEVSVTDAARRAATMVNASRAFAVASVTSTARRSTVGVEAVLVQYGTGAKSGALEKLDDIPVLRMGNVKHGEIDWRSLKYLPASHEDFPKLLLHPGDLLFNRTNSAELVGKSAVFDAAQPTSFASYLIRVRFGASVDPRWANIAINSPQGRAYVGSVVSQQVGQANVNGTKLKTFPLPVPALNEQRRLIAQHEEVVDSSKRLLASTTTARLRSTVLRRGLLDAAFSGRLTGTAPDSSAAEEMIGA